MTEQKIQKKVLDELNKIGWAVKVVSANRNGTPDILACVDGKFVAVECKRPGATTSKLQDIQGARIATNGGYFFTCSSVDQIKEIINEQFF